MGLTINIIICTKISILILIICCYFKFVEFFKMSIENVHCKVWILLLLNTSTAKCINTICN